MNVAITDITNSLTEVADKAGRDWGVEPNDGIDDELRTDLDNIREAELAAERNSSTLTVY